MAPSPLPALPAHAETGLPPETVSPPANTEALRAAHLRQVAGAKYGPRPAFDAKNVPLGMSLDEFRKRLPQCQISKPEGALSVDGLIGFDPPFTDLFPLVRGVYIGISVYYGSVPGLNRRHVTKYQLLCGDDEHELVVLDSTKQILLFRKALFVKGGGPRSQFDEARAALASICTGSMGPIHEARWRASEGPTVPAYATYCDQGFMRIILGSSTWLTGVYSPRHLAITYTDRLGWQKYMDECRLEIEPTKTDKEKLRQSF